MSEHDSWIAVQDMSEDKLLERLGLEETGEVGWHFKVGRPYALGRTPAGWPIIYANFNGLAHIDNVRELSYHGMVVACDFQNQVDGLTGLAIAAQSGEKLWEIGVADDELFVTGSPPPEFESIRDDYAAKLAADPETGWMYDVPIELAKALCGFRHDEDDSQFKGLRPRADSDWHRNLQFATHPKNQNPSGQLSQQNAGKSWWPVIILGLIGIVLILMV